MAHSSWVTTTKISASFSTKSDWRIRRRSMVSVARSVDVVHQSNHNSNDLPAGSPLSAPSTCRAEGRRRLPFLDAMEHAVQRGKLLSLL